MKFVVFDPRFEPMKASFNDIKKEENVKYYEHMQRGEFLDHLFMSHIIGKLSFLPIKSVWSWISVANSLPKNEQYAFLFIGLDLAYIAKRSGMIDLLKKRFKGSKFVAYKCDVIIEEKYDNEFLRNSFDLLYNMDEHDAKIKNMIYYPFPFSRGKTSDVSFVGQDKGRLNELVQLYDYLSSKGLKCDFYLVKVPAMNQIHREGIQYGDFIDSDTVFNRYIINTNCIIELHVNGRTCCSDRVQKAIAYNRKILTNDIGLLKNPFYSPDMIQVYNSIDDINIEFLKQSVFKTKYNYNDEYSPIHFLRKIKSDLCIE